MNTIFFEGFTTTFATDEVDNNLDPNYWVKMQGTGVVATHPRLDPGGWADGGQGSIDDAKYNMYRLTPHDKTDTTSTVDRVYAGQGVLSLTNFPVDISGVVDGSDNFVASGIGVGFYINKLASEPSGINDVDDYSQRLLKIYNSEFDDPGSDVAGLKAASGVIEIDVVHSPGTAGYGNTTTDPRNLSLRVRTPNANADGWVNKYYDVNVLGSVWNYLQPNQETNYTRDDQRIISTFIEDTNNDNTYGGDDYYNGLFVEISILSNGTNGVADPYEMQIRLNGMNIFEHGLTQDDQTLTGLVSHFNQTNVKYFDRIDWFGSRTGVLPHNETDNSNVDNDYTWIDDIYIIANSGTGVALTHNDNFLGASTKVYSLFPSATGINVDNSWRAFDADSGFDDIENAEVEYLKTDDGDNQYIYAENNDKFMMFDFDNIELDPALNINNYIIGGIKITNSSRKVSKDVSFQNAFASGTDLTNPTAIAQEFYVTGTTYEYQNQYIMDNPLTNQKWTTTDINDGHFGIVKRS